MYILAVNTGSSSVRLALFEAQSGLRKIAEDHSRGDLQPAARLREFCRAHALSKLDCVVHRVVHGGASLVRPCFIDAALEEQVRSLAPLAPLHNPRALAWMGAAREVFGHEVPQIAVFDTAHYARLPEVARTYALPHELANKHGVRRYGFHGLAHAAMWNRWAELNPTKVNGSRVISLQLGSGTSVTASLEGAPIDTSMGFSPLEGLMMATRSGDIDPGLLLFLQRSEGWSTDALDAVLNKQSGLLGVSGQSADMQKLLRSDASRARLAIDLYCYRAKKYIGAYVAALGGVDAILFGGGVGEHAPLVRSKILSGLDFLGITTDATLNEQATGQECCIGASDKVQVWVIAVDESRAMAEAASAMMAMRDGDER